jgi:hypothetical protein
MCQEWREGMCSSCLPEIWQGAPFCFSNFVRTCIPNKKKRYESIARGRHLQLKDVVVLILFLTTLYNSKFRKYLYYMISSALEDEETQSKGIVLVVLNHSPTWFLDSFWRAWRDIRVPFRISRLHYCAISPDSSYSCRESEEHSTVVRVHQGKSHTHVVDGLWVFIK